MELIDDVCHMESRFALFGDNGCFDADRCMICKEHTICFEINLDAPNGTPRWRVSYGILLRSVVHISSTKTNTVSKQTKARFHMTHVMKEFHRVHPHWFPSILYVPCKPCTYLASRLALSPNRQNRASTWASSSRSTNRCVKNGFLDYGALGTNYAPICIETTIVSKQSEARFHVTHVIYEFHWVRPNWFLNIWYVPFKLYNYLASRLALSPNRPNRASTWASSTTSTIGCV